MFRTRPFRHRLSVCATAVLMALSPLQAFAQGSAGQTNAGPPERTPGQRPTPGTMEAGLWDETVKAEKAASTSGERDNDPALNAYVSGVVAKVAGPFAGDVRVYVMDRPIFNAFMASNGYTEVWTGLLLRCQTEDQLAFAVGHESAHFRHSHVLEGFQQQKNGGTFTLIATSAIAVVGVSAASNASSIQQMQNILDTTRHLINITYIGTISALMRYSRERETEADAYGLDYAAKAGYFIGNDADLWRESIGETLASDYPKVRRSGAHSSIFDDHPLDTDRIDAMEAQDKRLHGGQPSTRSLADERQARLNYRAHIRPYLGAWLKDDLRRQDYGQTLYVIDRLSIDGEDMGVLDFYKGEAYRLRDGVLDRINAILSYKAALNNADAPAEAWRELGELYRRNGDIQDAITAYSAYLDKAPSAADAWIVRDQRDTLMKTVAPNPQPSATLHTSMTSPGGNP